MSRLLKPGTPPSTGAERQPRIPPWQRDKQSAEGATNGGADGAALTAAPAAAVVPAPAVPSAGDGAEPATLAPDASGAGRLALADSLSSSSARFFGTAVSFRGSDGEAGGSGVGKGRKSCPALSRSLQPTPSVRTEALSRDQAQAHSRLSIPKQSPMFAHESSAVARSRLRSRPRAALPSRRAPTLAIRARQGQIVARRAARPVESFDRKGRV